MAYLSMMGEYPTLESQFNPTAAKTPASTPAYPGQATTQPTGQTTAATNASAPWAPTWTQYNGVAIPTIRASDLGYYDVTYGGEQEPWYGPEEARPAATTPFTQRMYQLNGDIYGNLSGDGRNSFNSWSNNYQVQGHDDNTFSVLLKNADKEGTRVVYKRQGDYWVPEDPNSANWDNRKEYWDSNPGEPMDLVRAIAAVAGPAAIGLALGGTLAGGMGGAMAGAAGGAAGAGGAATAAELAALGGEAVASGGGLAAAGEASAAAGAAGAGGMTAADLAAAYGPGVLDGTSAASGFAPGAAGSAATWTPGAGVVAGEGGAATVGAGNSFFDTLKQGYDYYNKAKKGINFYNQITADPPQQRQRMTPPNYNNTGVYGNGMPGGGGFDWGQLPGMIFGGGGNGGTGLLDIWGAVEGSRQMKDYSGNMKTIYENELNKRDQPLNLLNQSYQDPSVFYNSSQWKGLNDVYQNSVDRQAAKGGTLGNPTQREVLLQNNALKELENWRNGLRQQAGVYKPNVEAMTRAYEAEARANNPYGALGGRGSIGGPGMQGGAGGIEGLIRQIMGAGGSYGNNPAIAKTIEQMFGGGGDVGMGSYLPGGDMGMPSYNPYTGYNEPVFGGDTWGDGPMNWGAPQIDPSFAFDYSQMTDPGYYGNIGNFDFGSAPVEDIGDFLGSFLEW